MSTRTLLLASLITGMGLSRLTQAGQTQLNGRTFTLPDGFTIEQVAGQLVPLAILFGQTLATGRYLRLQIHGRSSQDLKIAPLVLLGVEENRSFAFALFEAGADIFLIACTELSVMGPPDGVDLPAIDTLDVLVEATLATARA